MGDVEFFEEETVADQRQRTWSRQVIQGGLQKAVIKTGLVKNEEQANVLLVTIALVFFAASVLFFAIGIYERQQRPLLPDPSSETAEQSE